MALVATNSEPFNTSKHRAYQNSIYKISGPLIINIKLMLFVEIIDAYLQ
jgi:hypothetical protein